MNNFPENDSFMNNRFIYWKQRMILHGCNFNVFLDRYCSYLRRYSTFLTHEKDKCALSSAIDRNRKVCEAFLRHSMVVLR